MPRTKPCSKCGDPRPVGLGSRSEVTCQPCRRVAHGLLPTQKVNDNLAFVHSMGSLEAKRLPACARCTSPIDAASRRWKYCSNACLDAERARRGFGQRSKAPAAERGYGRKHREMRAKLLPLAFGTPCHLCGDLMQEGQDLHLDHTEDRTGYRGMAHSSCNVRDGARRSAEVQRRKRLEMGWRIGQDPSSRRRPACPAA